MSLELSEIQKSIRAAITLNTTLMNILSDGSDSVVDNPTNLGLNYPYISFVGMTIEADDTTSSDGNIIFITLGAYTQTGNKLQAQSILKELNNSLHKKHLNVTNLNYCYSKIDFSEVLIDDQDTSNGFNAIIRLRLNTY